MTKWVFYSGIFTLDPALLWLLFSGSRNNRLLIHDFSSLILDCFKIHGKYDDYQSSNNNANKSCFHLNLPPSVGLNEDAGVTSFGAVAICCLSKIWVRRVVISIASLVSNLTSFRPWRLASFTLAKNLSRGVRSRFIISFPWSHGNSQISLTFEWPNIRICPESIYLGTKCLSM